MNKPALYIDYKTNEVVVLNNLGQEVYRAKYDDDDNWANAHFIYYHENFKARNK